MKGVTVWQPYAGLIAAGTQRVINRSWRPGPRGRLAICAGPWRLRGWGTDVPRGATRQAAALNAIVAVADVVGFVRPGTADVDRLIAERPDLAWLADHRYATGPWSWVLGSIWRVDPPAPCIGGRRTWQVPSDVAGEVRRHMSCQLSGFSGQARGGSLNADG